MAFFWRSDLRYFAEVTPLHAAIIEEKGEEFKGGGFRRSDLRK